jgi:hypothetical protein
VSREQELGAGRSARSQTVRLGGPSAAAAALSSAVSTGAGRGGDMDSQLDLDPPGASLAAG